MSSISSGTPAVSRTADPVYQSLIWRRNLFGVLAVVFLFLSAATAVLDVATTVQVDRTFPVGPAPRLIVHDGVGGGLRGGIAVHAGDAAQLHIEGKVHGTWRVHYVLEQRGDDVVIEAQPRHLLGWLSVLGPARFTITAPAQTRFDIDSCSAPIDVERITGGGAARTTNGTIQLRGLGGSVSAATTNGAIEVAGFDGSATLQTTNGTINVHDGHGSFDATAINGTILLDAELASTARRAQTVNGSVTVRLRGEPSLRIDAHTVNGAITVSPAVTGRERQRNSFAGTIGAGDGALSLQTVNGKIVVE